MFVTKIIDFLSSKNIESFYQIYKKTQWYDEEQMKQFQIKKLRKLIDHCYYNVPYYRNFMDQNRISPKEILYIDDIKKFPILTKEIIKDNYNDFIPNNIKELKGVKVSQTGGTTGNILFKRNDSNTRSSVWASFKRFSEDWMEVGDRERKLILMGGHVMGSSPKEKLKKWVIDFINNQKSFSPYDTSDENVNNIIKELDTHKYVHIRSYSQFLYQFGLKLKQQNKNYHLKSITTTAEPLMPEHRALFTEVFNAQVFDQYGCGEVGGIAYECERHEGMHITEERVIVEVNDKNELIVTDLDNYAMPFIRYWNADQILLKDGFCSCGRKSKRIEQVLGRTCDYIIGVNGEILHWAYFWHLFFDSNIAENKNLKKFQVVQESEDLLKIRMVCDELSDEEKTMLRNNIQERIGNIDICFCFENEIENSKSGKYRPVINKLLER